MGAICGAGVVKGFQKHVYESNGGGANVVNSSYNKGGALPAHIIGTFILIYTVFCWKISYKSINKMSLI